MAATVSALPALMVVVLALSTEEQTCSHGDATKASKVGLLEQETRV